MSFLLQISNVGDTLTNTVSALTTTTTTNPQPEKEMQILDLAIKGGWAMIPIVIMGLLSVYLIVERIVAVSKAASEDATFMHNIKDFIHNGKVDAALSLCRATKTPIARMIEKGITRIGGSLEDISVAIENTAKLEVYRLEKGLSILATIAGAAPMMGLIGTVMGMVQTFFELANGGQGVKVDQLAGGVYQAMVATVSGLIVGVLAYIGYNLLVARVEKVVYKMELRSVEFLDILHEPAK